MKFGMVVQDTWVILTTPVLELRSWLFELSPKRLLLEVFCQQKEKVPYLILVDDIIPTYLFTLYFPTFQFLGIWRTLKVLFVPKLCLLSPLNKPQ